MIRVFIPGLPFAQPRARHTVINGHAVTYDTKEAKSWKAMAAWHMTQAVRAVLESSQPKYPPLSGALQLHVIVIFALPKSKWKKRAPMPMTWHTSRPDGDNILKAVKDAAKGILWNDDSQVADARIQKVVGAQGQAPGTYLVVQQMPTLMDEHVNALRPIAGHCWDMIDGGADERP